MIIASYETVVMKVKSASELSSKILPHLIEQFEKKTARWSTIELVV